MDNPRLNNQSNNVNKNRFHRVPRYNKKYPQGYYHTGVDILASIGTPLKSMLCGIVVEARDTKGDLGIVVMVKSKDKDSIDIWIKYCHLKSFSVSKNTKVMHGDIIGLTGNTGNARNIYHNIGMYILRHQGMESSMVVKKVDPEQFMKTKFDETKEGNVILQEQ